MSAIQRLKSYLKGSPEISSRECEIIQKDIAALETLWAASIAVADVQDRGIEPQNEYSALRNAIREVRAPLEREVTLKVTLKTTEKDNDKVGADILHTLVRAGFAGASVVQRDPE